MVPQCIDEREDQDSGRIRCYYRVPTQACDPVLGAEPGQERSRPARDRLYDEAVRQALLVLWEAGDRVCGKRLNALIPVLIGAMERHGHSRAYKKNDQAWVEQKNGAIIRRLVGYGRLSGLAATQALAQLYGAARLYVNFFQPSFKLKSKRRDGARVSKTYHAPATPCDRLLAAPCVSETVKLKLKEQFDRLDPVLLRDVRAAQQVLSKTAARGPRDPSQFPWPRTCRSSSKAWQLRGRTARCARRTESDRLPSGGGELGRTHSSTLGLSSKAG